MSRHPLAPDRAHAATLTRPQAYFRDGGKCPEAVPLRRAKLVKGAKYAG